MFFQAALTLFFAALANASLQIVSGGSWTSQTTGLHVQAHGAGVIKVGSTWYIIGENHQDGYYFQSVNCYSSTNLVDWTYVGELLSLEDSGDLGPSRVVERPKVIYNDDTGLYVMYMHIDDSSYAEAKVGVATGTSVCGNYTYQGSFQPLAFQSRDMSLYKDDNGTAYLLSEDRANGLRIDRLSDDYLSVAYNVYTWAEKYEAPAVLKKDGVYFMFSSQLTDANDNKYSSATSLSGPWSAWQDFAPSGTYTYTSQTTFVLPVGDLAMYALFMGDRWVSSNLMRSTYVWLPLTISGTNASVTWYENWVIDAAAGTWSTPPSDNSYEAESSSNTLGGGAETVSCSGCSGSTAIGYLGGTSYGSLQFNGVYSSTTTTTTIRIEFANGDSIQRYAAVSVNGVSQRVAFLPTGTGQTVGVASFNAKLISGSSNTVNISGIDGGWAPDIDRILVPVS
ncbi:hypothetical protein RUND412_005446 [Rhizina undulata]